MTTFAPSADAEPGLATITIPAPIPTPSQQRAIEAEPRALLVLAGPGAGKTFCLIERIRFLIDRHGYDPARICAFTFTNKAAGEIAERLTVRLGERGQSITRGTIHAFCAELLRKHGALVQLAPGFGIIDEDYQERVLHRVAGYNKWHRAKLNRFSAFRFRNAPLDHRDLPVFYDYEGFLAKHNILDFDQLIIKAAELLERMDAAIDGVRARWDVVLVDEFQDLNPVQYRVIRALARDHGHVFAVGDDEQSIYSWAGADPGVFRQLLNDFQLSDKTQLRENRRCPASIFSLARALIARNTPIFAERTIPVADRESAYCTQALGFETDDEEAAWIVDDIRHDRARNSHRWGDVAVLYRKHTIGHRLETALLNAGVPCRLAHGRALAEDPAISYVIAAMRVIANPEDDVCRDAFFQRLLPRALFDQARANAEQKRLDLFAQLKRMATRRQRREEHARRIRRAIADWNNLRAVGKQHTTLTSLVVDLLSKKVGTHASVLDERHDELSDPEATPEVVALAARLREARARRAHVRVPSMGGVDIPVRGMLLEIGVDAVRGDAPFGPDVELLDAAAVPSLGFALGVFKAAQLVELTDWHAQFTSFTAIDLETTDNNPHAAEIVEIAAVRVRDGVIVDSFRSFVKPRAAITAGARATHGIQEEDVRDAPPFAELWPRFRDFCGADVIVAHNGYDFDFRVLGRMVIEAGDRFELCTYDTLPLARDLFPTSCNLGALAARFGIETGRSHRALDDSRTLAAILIDLGAMKLARARKTGLADLLGYLGIALALSDEETLCPEARLFREFTRPFALGRYDRALEWYGKEQGDDLSLPTVDEVIERLGGAALMARIRAEKSADERYPAAMRRLRRLIAELPGESMEEQRSHFLERVVLSKHDGDEPARERVNLLTLHSTKGLEFSRVYVVGAEDGQLPGSRADKPATAEEIEEGRRLLYVGMTRAVDRLVLTRVESREDKSTGGHRFLDEMGLTLVKPALPVLPTTPAVPKVRTVPTAPMRPVVPSR